MAPTDSDEMKARFTLRLPSNLNTAVDRVANELDYRAGAHDRVTKSEVIRDAVEKHLVDMYQSGELSEETSDLLDEDLKANAGKGEIET